MSIESLEEMLKKQMPPQPDVQVPYAIATPEEMQAHMAKAKANPIFKPGAPKLKDKAMESKKIDVDGYLKSQQEAALKETATAPSSSTEDFLNKLKSLKPTTDKPYDPISSPIEQEIKRMRERQSGGDGQGIHWAELAGMGISTLAGAFNGQLGAGAIPAGQYGISRAREERKRSRDLDKMITELQGKLALAQGRAASRNPADPVVEVRGPDNKPYSMRLSEAKQLGLPTYKEDSFTFLKGDVGGVERYIPASTKTGQEAAPGSPLAKSERSKDSFKSAKSKIDTENAITSDYKQEIQRVQKSISEYQNVQEAMRSGDPTRQVTGVMGFLRVVDPESVARESEVAAILGARSKEDMVRIIDDILLGNTKLTPKQAAVIANASDSILNNVVTNYENISARNMEQRARSVELDTAFIPKFSGRYKRFEPMKVEAQQTRPGLDRDTGIITGPMKRGGQVILGEDGKPQMFRYRKVTKPDGTPGMELVQ